MRGRASDALRKELENDIERGRLSPGDKVDEQTLAKRFDVSRTPAREALLQLAAAGLVRLVPRQGAVVNGVSPQMAIGLVEVLTALEAEAAGLAARRMTLLERRRLAELHRAAEGVAKRLDSAAYIKSNIKFHATIYQGSRNEYLTEQILLTRRRMRFYHGHSLNQPARVKASWLEHTAVVAAIMAGDEPGAQAAMRDHVLFGGKVFADLVASIGKS
jgi:DNA-binding GntR family transcriptional regulator